MHNDLAVRILLGQLFAGSEVLVPGPAGRQLAQAGSVPLVQVDRHIHGQTAGREDVDLVLILVGVGAPLLNKIQAVASKALGQVHQQAVLPALGGVGHAEAEQHVHLIARDDRGIQADVAVRAVLVDFIANLDVRIVLVELGDHRVGAVLAGKSGIELDFTGQLGGVFRDISRRAFRDTCHAEHHDHRDGQQGRDKLLHVFVLLVVFVDHYFTSKAKMCAVELP